jgi:basic amino acid/polyamine antiporter, APA family
MLFRTKSVESVLAHAASKEGFQRRLSGWDLLALGVGATIGAGIFVLAGTAAKQAGPAVTISFVLAAIGCTLAAYAYAELASTLPVAGSAYAYSLTALGELPAFMVGWFLFLEYSIGASLVASGWSGYVQGLAKEAGMSLPGILSSNEPNLMAAGIVSVLALIALIGVRESATFTNIMVVVKVCVVLVVIVAGATAVDTTNWTPFVPLGWGAVFRTTTFIFLAYLGFDVVATAAAEVKNPERDLKIGILGSLGICTVLYVSMAFVLTGMVKYTSIEETDPLLSAFSLAGLKALGGLISVGAIVGMTSVLLAFLIGLPRILQAIAQDGLLPSWVSKIHPKTGTPVASTLLSGFTIAVAAALFPLDDLATLAGVGTLIAFAAVCATVTVLRKRHPELARPFRMPGPDWVPLLGVALFLVLAASMLEKIWFPLCVFIVIGLAVYFCYSRSHSQLNEVTDPES